MDEIADELGLRSGMLVTLFYEEELGDKTEEFEVSAVLEEHDDLTVRWRAMPDWSTVRWIR